jgi:predicted O-methyltransferase YrrM
VTQQASTQERGSSFSIEPYYKFYNDLGIDSDLFREWSIKEEEALILRDLCVGACSVVTIGVFGGLSTAIALDAMPDVSVYYAIDPFFSRYAALDNYRAAYEATIASFRRSGQRVTTLHGFASIPGAEVDELAGGDEWWKDFSTWYQLNRVAAEIDLCFIDGDHHKEVATTDFLTVWPRIRPGGNVVLHDISDPIWEPELACLLKLIARMPDATVSAISTGINGIATVTKGKAPRLEH